MPSVYANASVTPSSGTDHYAEATLDVGEASGADWTATATVTPDENPWLAATGQVASEYGLEVWVDGSQVAKDLLRGGISVSRSIDSYTQSASFAAKHNSLASTTAFQRLAPQTCDDTVTVYGVYRVNGSTYRYQLLADGITDNVSMQASGTEASGVVDSYQVLDGGARLAAELVTMILPEGHNLHRERVARKVLTQAGESAYSFERGEHRANKAVQLVDANPAEFVADYFSTEHRGFVLDRNGNWTNPQRKSDDTTAAVTLSPDDAILEASVQMTVPGDVITKIVLSGTEQIVPEEDDTGGETCGTETRVRELEIERSYAPLSQKYSQSDVDGSLTDRGITQKAASLIEAQRVRITQTFYCEDLLEEKKEVWSYYNPIRARYEYDSSGNLDYNQTAAGHPVFLPDGSVADGSNEGRYYGNEKWLKVSEEITSHFYDQPIIREADGSLDNDTYYGPGIGDVSSEHKSHFVHTGDGAEFTEHGTTTFTSTKVVGSKLGTIRTLKRWYNPRASVKERSAASDTWETQQFTDGRKLTGKKIGVENDRENFIVTDKDYHLLFPKEDGTIEQEITFSQRYATAPGSLFLYADGTTGDAEFQDVQTIETQETTYIAGDTSYARLTTTTELDGDVTVESESGITGSGPAIPTVRSFEDTETQDLDDEDSESRLENVDPTEQRPITATITSNLGSDDVGCHLPKTAKTTVPWAENVQELEYLGERMISESAAFRVQMTTLPLYSLDEGELIHITYPPLDIDHDATVHLVKHAWGIGDSPTGDRVIPATTITALIHPEDM